MPGALCEGNIALAVVTGCPLPLSGIGYLEERKFDVLHRAEGR